MKGLREQIKEAATNADALRLCMQAKKGNYPARYVRRCERAYLARGGK
jgi:hypothetical protein